MNKKFKYLAVLGLGLTLAVQGNVNAEKQMDPSVVAKIINLTKEAAGTIYFTGFANLCKNGLSRISKIDQLNQECHKLGGVGFLFDRAGAMTWDYPLMNFKENSASYMNGNDFKNLNLSHSCFHNCSLDRANFEGANLDGADFSNASILDAKFKGATGTENTNFHNARVMYGWASRQDAMQHAEIRLKEMGLNSIIENGSYKIVRKTNNFYLRQTNVFDKTVSTIAGFLKHQTTQKPQAATMPSIEEPKSGSFGGLFYNPQAAQVTEELTD
ncbi:TPA: hypothetical protein DEO28_00170 [Candidatus Dependentiae bacterium]|nr:MAG: Pentapeptide repeat family protein [candidate division TM6 bacterium GW2011_GWE2_31_21]KKP54012.1 MAG: Pentapeptide repeat family protein [candidate division TM6 bacterium GW2011_GWF2_33_332]HBS48407.1 hypothetical protein [Candidatus Dependentiae bacterium]HBZ72919.1 hypothetical protein [Candidatus Dependentiae bacterium]